MSNFILNNSTSKGIIKCVKYIDPSYKHKIINGSLLSQAMKKVLRDKLQVMNQTYSHLPPPKLNIILIGDRPDSRLYVENKIKMCKLLGIKSELIQFTNLTEAPKVIKAIHDSNHDDKVHGIIVQLPLPDHLIAERTKILSQVDTSKDVDGLNPLNQGKILQMKISECLLPPTAMGVLEILRLVINHNNNIEDYVQNYLIKNCFDDQTVNLSGKNVTVLGRGLTAGLPLSILMQKCDGTVTLCHSKTLNTNEMSYKADILISAVGKPGLVRDYVKNNSIVIDVGISVEEDRNGNKHIRGDVSFEEVLEKVSYITPVPGGVGKMTVIMLLKNVIKSWGVINKINF